jgi:hypothetical protein
MIMGRGKRGGRVVTCIPRLRIVVKPKVCDQGRKFLESKYGGVVKKGRQWRWGLWRSSDYVWKVVLLMVGRWRCSRWWCQSNDGGGLPAL